MASGKGRYELGVETRVKDLASKDLRKLGKTGKKAGDSIAKGFIKAQLALGALKLAIKGAIRVVRSFTTDIAAQGDEIAKMSKSLGVGVTALSELQFVAQRSGASLQELRVALKTLAKNAFDMSEGTGEARRSFEALGIRVTTASGGLKKLKPLFIEIADKLGKMTDSSKRAAMATQIFGRSGERLVPMFLEQREGIERLIARLHDLGGAWTVEGAQRAEEFQDSMLDLDTAILGLKISLAEELLPVIRRYIDNLTDWIAANKDLIAQQITEFIQEAIPYVETFAEAMWETAKAMKAVVEVAKGLIDFWKQLASGDFFAGMGKDAGKLPRWATKEGAEELYREVTHADFYERMDDPDAWYREFTTRFIAAWNEMYDLAAEGPKHLRASFDDLGEYFDAAANESLPRMAVGFDQLAESARNAAVQIERTVGTKSTHPHGMAPLETAITGPKAATAIPGEKPGPAAELPEPPEPTAWQQYREQIEATKMSVQEFGDEVVMTGLDALQDGFANFFDAIASGSASTSDALRAMASDILRSLQRVAMNQLFSQLFSAALGAIGGAAGGAGSVGPTEPGSLFSMIGMADGGVINEPIIGVGRSGQRYAFGESGPEAVVPMTKGGLTGGSGGGVSIGAVHVHPSPGMDETALANLVVETIDRQSRSSSGFRNMIRRTAGDGLQ